MGQIVSQNNLTSWTADGAITKDTVVVTDAAGIVKTGANENDANIQGVAASTVADGEAVGVSGTGDHAWVTAGAAITYGARLIIGDSSGRVIVCPEAAGTTYNVVGHSRGTCSNADEKVTALINIYTHTVET